MSAVTDARFMRLALREGRRGVGRTSPNPPVGAVVVRGGAVVGRGYHRQAGLPHAEVDALRAAGPRARGATLYVTLEPCAHHGRTPPCTEAILAAGVRRVVVGARDPNPTVAGDGLGRLRAAGVAVTHGVEAVACEELIAAFRKHVTTGLPLVTLKLAASLDGRIATRTGDSRWITGAASRRFVHRLRAEHDAILVGAGTVIARRPRLDLPDARRPQPVARRRRRPAAHPADGAGGDDVRRGADRRSDRPGRAGGAGPATGARRRRGRAAAGVGGAHFLPARAPRPGQRGLCSVLVEGGATLAAAALAAGGVDRLLAFYAPTLIGADGRPMLAGNWPSATCARRPGWGRCGCGEWQETSW